MLGKNPHTQYILKPFVISNLFKVYLVRVTIIDGDTRTLCKVIDPDKPTKAELKQLKDNVKLLKLELL